MFEWLTTVKQSLKIDKDISNLLSGLDKNIELGEAVNIITIIQEMVTLILAVATDFFP